MTSIFWVESTTGSSFSSELMVCIGVDPELELVGLSVHEEFASWHGLHSICAFFESIQPVFCSVDVRKWLLKTPTM